MKNFTAFSRKKLCDIEIDYLKKSDIFKSIRNRKNSQAADPSVISGPGKGYDYAESSSLCFCLSDCKFTYVQGGEAGRASLCDGLPGDGPAPGPLLYRTPGASGRGDRKSTRLNSSH